MRTREEVEEFKSKAFQLYVMNCKSCYGKDSKCLCRIKYDIALLAYEGCIPQDFWCVKEGDVTNNIDVFKQTVIPYVKNLRKALKYGYGLVFFGDNGVGKTYFMSYILMSAIRKGKTVYFTSMPDLDYNIKRGFRDSEIEKRLNYMLSSDFLAIDELGKERIRTDNSYTDSQVERILKKRLDDNFPVLLATNMDYQSLSESYGPTVTSMLSGKFQMVTMEPGDFRTSLRERMIKEMGYE